MTRGELSDDLVATFTAMAEAEMVGLRRFALGVCADPHRADDLVQEALERVYAVWPRVHAVERPGAYLRTVLVRSAMREQRRSRWTRESPTASPPEAERPAATGSDPLDGVSDRLDLQQLLATLSLKQRAVLVLRFVEDRSVAETAAVLGVGQGTVKRTSHDALALLRSRHPAAVLRDGGSQGPADGPTGAPDDVRSAR